MKKVNIYIFFLFLSLFFKANAQTISADIYKEKYGKLASSLSESSGIPASIILGVAMHESANGNSRNAKWLNNHFGIKGPNNLKAKGAKFKSSYKEFDSVEDSYSYFIKILSNRKTYTSLWKHKKNDYKAWAMGLQRVGYATSKIYSEQLIATIKKNKLYEFDSVEKQNDKAETVVDAKEVQNSFAPKGITLYKVKKGDSLSKIAVKFSTSVNKLKALNNLKNNTILAGTKIKVKE